MRGSVIRYDGARGTVWRIKYADASGTQVMETIGAERDGITRKDADDELRALQATARPAQTARREASAAASEH